MRDRSNLASSAIVQPASARCPIGAQHRIQLLRGDAAGRMRKMHPTRYLLVRSMGVLDLVVYGPVALIGETSLVAAIGTALTGARESPNSRSSLHLRCSTGISRRRRVRTRTARSATRRRERPSRGAATIRFRFFAPIAQLDRASGCGPEGRMFESCWARQPSPRERGHAGGQLHRWPPAVLRPRRADQRRFLWTIAPSSSRNASPRTMYVDGLASAGFSANGRSARLIPSIRNAAAKARKRDRCSTRAQGSRRLPVSKTEAAEPGLHTHRGS